MPILRAEMTASLGMSEPGAGSDLASLRTRAERRWRRVRGERAEGVDVRRPRRRCAVDFRSHRSGCRQAQGHQRADDPDRPARCGAPAVRLGVRPDDLDFNEVFFNDVRVPAENLVGPLNEGWRVANGSLGHERNMLWLSYADRLRGTRRGPPAVQRAGPGPVRHAGDGQPGASVCSARWRWRGPRAATRTRRRCRC